ncbi:hypothetical protein [Lysinibacillus sp. SGAir0095]|uniref:hypothetical protein n=1 Tax=Lysinibacillus sp. SGAir0095 TaxID=2070463 RepID=UPI0010CD1708|nr:hypothetical protein [Lysinibacillus sp. SGAir0095]QCR33162.1 hypothetical protein C1N55_13655 [Lysinibacillus sp. SGAir0095]
MTGEQKTTVSAQELLNEKNLKYLYSQLNKTDREIAEFLEIDRTYITKARRTLGINTRIGAGRIGELKAIKILRSLGFKVKDLNLKNKLSSFDLLVDDFIRIEIKSSNINKVDKRYRFSLSEQAKRQCIESDERIVLPSGRTKKVFSKTCDFIIFVCIGSKEDTFYVMPSDFLAENMNMVTITRSSRVYEKFKNNWDLLRKEGNIS